MRIVDLSVTLDEDPWAPWWARNRIRRQSHRAGRWVIRLLFGLPRRLLRTRTGWAHESIRLSTHGTTHVDAPWHYAPTSEGRPARTIDELPLAWFFAPGVCLDCTGRPDGHALSVAEIEAALAAAGHTLSPGDIVLIRTGNYRFLGSRDYFRRGCGVSAEATRWLIDRGVRVMGIDSWGWDPPLPLQAERARRENRDDVFWAAHFVGVDREYCQIERLANLDALPPTGFRVAAFPLKVRRGSAGPARVVAILDDAEATT
ncbi:MAG: Kynurenine formamidase [Phycisphaerae bacterium]|nr:Kynurenine formamidase [Phycisphaerae bacterium]